MAYSVLVLATMTLAKIARDKLALAAAKKEGHAIIERIVRRGIPRDHIYEEVAKRIGCSIDGAHFGRTYTFREVRARIDALLSYEQEILRANLRDVEFLAKKTVEMYRDLAETQTRKDEEIRRVSEYNKLSGWKKFLLRIVGIDHTNYGKR